jgi:hypothetical protein
MILGTPAIYTLAILNWLNAWMITPCVLSTMRRNIGYKHSFKHFDRNLVFILLGIMKSKKRKSGN